MLKNKRNVIAILIFNFGIGAYWMVENFWINLYWTRNIDQQVFFVGLMVSLSAIVGVVTQIFFGAFSDSSTSRFGRRRPFMLFAAITGGIAMCFFPMTKLFSVLIMAVIFGILMDAFITFFGDISTPARLAFLTENTEVEKRGTVNAFLGITGAISIVMVVGLSGYIVDFAGPDFAFYLGGISLIVCGIIFFFVSREEPQLKSEKTWFQNLKETFTLDSYRENKSLYMLILFLFINTMGIQVVSPFLFIYIETVFQLEGFMLAVIIAALGMMGFVISFPIGLLLDKIGRRFITVIVTIGLVISAICFAFIPIGMGDSTLFYVFLLGGLFVGFAAAINAATDTWMEDLAPEDRRGSMLAYKVVAMVTPMVPGALIGGYLADNGPKPAECVYSPLIFIICAIIVVFSIPVLKYISETLKKDHST